MHIRYKLAGLFRRFSRICVFIQGQLSIFAQISLIPGAAAAPVEHGLSKLARSKQTRGKLFGGFPHVRAVIGRAGKQR